jgi:hypothetical protein
LKPKQLQRGLLNSSLPDPDFAEEAVMIYVLLRDPEHTFEWMNISHLKPMEFQLMVGIT